MTDADLAWGGDIGVSPTGDILLAADDAITPQRVMRRLLTNSGDYIWHAGYGAGLGEFVGNVANARQIVGNLRGQLFDESAVARSPPPAVDVDVLADGSVYVDLRYIDAVTYSTQALTFTVSG